ncbi:MAG TPA: hypothetical protein VHC22_30995 [Pirellulales bacterium]|nr:hypothetical protein [Pirellulales bacterium]
MLRSLLQSLGVTEEISSHLEHVTPAVQRPAWLWLGLVLLVPLAWFIYRRQRDNLASVPPHLRLALTATRVLILLLLVLTLAGPYLKLDMQIEKKPVLAMLFDESESMGLEAGPFETDEAVLAAAEAAGYPVTDGKVDATTRKALEQMTRAQFVKAAVERRAKEWLDPLAEKYDVRLYAVGEQVKPLPFKNGAFELPEMTAQGHGTHLGDGLAQVLDEAAGRQIASIVVFSDGQNTGGRSPAEMAQVAREAGAPVFAVPAGSDVPLQDLGIVDVFAPDAVHKDDTVTVAATVQLQGYAELAVQAQLLADGQTEPLAKKDLVLHRTEQQQVELPFKADKVGANTLTVKLVPASPLPHDLEANNSDDILVRVMPGNLKVLYVEGLPRWDFRFLKNAIRRDNGLKGLGLKGSIVAGTAAGGASTTAAATEKQGASSGDQPPPDVVLEAEVRRRPASEQQILPSTVDALAEYHTIILGDVSPTLVDHAFVKVLAEAVRERGVGLIVEAGPNAMPFAFEQEFLDLLPVKMRPKTGLEAQPYKPFKLELSADGALHETMRLFDDAGRNENVWEQMPPFYWCAAVERAAPSATVLAYNASLDGRYGKLPLVAHHYAGQGKVLFVGTDSTWLWRQNVGERFFYKFWGQAIRFVSRRDDDQKKKSWVEVRPVRARPGDPAQIELMAIKPDGAPRTDPTVTLRVERAGAPADTVELVADKATLGRYTGKYVPNEKGNYRVVYDPGGEPVEAHLHVRPSTEELRRPNVDREALAQLGKIVAPKDLASIAGELKGEPKTISLHREASIWDNWLILALLITIYSIDVGLRRLSGLS